jgi:mannose-1-phosphate guanylyltransferase
VSPRQPIRDAVILAGGFGTRLRPLTAKTPKPLLPLGNRPFLESLFLRLAQAGVRRAVLSAFHQASTLKAALPTLRRFGLAVRLVRERQPLGTGGAIRYAWPDEQAPCLALNGDILSLLELGPMMRAHAASGADATLWSIDVEQTAAFGVIEADRQGRVTRFVEKPRPGESASHAINAGLYALQPSVRAAIPAGRAVSVEREVFPGLLAAGASLRLYRAPQRPYWSDIGTPAAYLQAHRDLLKGALGRPAAARALWGKPDAQGSLRGPACRVAAGAVVRASALGADCSVGARARVEDSVLGAGCRVGEGAVLKGVLLAPGCRVGARCQLPPGTVLGPGSRLADDSRL